MRKPGFFATLLRRRRRSDFEPTVAFALRSVLGRGLLRDGAAAAPILCEPMDLDALLQEIPRSGPGWLAAFHRDTDLPEVVILAPESFGTLAKMATVFEGAASFLSLVPAGGRPCHRYFRSYGPDDAAELTWRLSGCRGYQLQGQGIPRVLACVRESTAAQFEQGLAEDRELQDSLREHLADNEAREQGSAPKTLRLLVPRELALASLLLPPRAPCGSQTLESLAASVAAEPDLPALHRSAGVWIGSAFESTGRRFTLFYFFPASDPAKAAARREACKTVASCLVRASLPRLASALGSPVQNPTLGLDARPDPTSRGRYVDLRARLRLGSSEATLDLLLEAALLPALAGKARDRAAVMATARTAAPILPLALGLPGPLAGEGLAAFPRSFIDPRLGAEHFPFSLFAELVTERDLALLLQNHVQRLLGRGGLKRLYAWAEEGVDARGQKTRSAVVPLLFDEERLLRQLPQQARDAWMRDGVRTLGTRADFLSDNRRVLMGIDQAARRQALLLSPRARWLLATCVIPPLRAQARARLKALAEAGQPFATLRTLRRAQLQQLLATQPNRTLCLGLLEARNEVGLISANIGSRRWRALRQDLSRAQEQLEGGFLEADEVIEAKNEMERAARTLLDRSEPSNREAKTGSRGAPPRERRLDRNLRQGRES